MTLIPEDDDPLALFLKNVACGSARPAVRDKGSVISYGEFGDIVARLAGALALLHQAPKVAIAMPQGAMAYAAMLATMMAGGVYAPINSDNPLARQAKVIAQFGPDIVLAPRSLHADFSAAVPDARMLDPELAWADAPPLAEPRPKHRLAYVIFTSGSTGTPKGVMIPRGALAHYLRWAIPALQVTPEDVVSQHPNIGFDLSVIDIYAALCGGACLVPLTSRKDRLTPAQFVRDAGITIWVSVPSVVDLMRRAGHDQPAFLGAVRTFFFCGEPLLKAHLDSLFAAAPGSRVINAYGPTEATVSCTALTLTAGDYAAACRANVAIGSAIPGMQVTLVGGDDAFEGELVLSGPQVADGYLDDPRRTAESFGLLDGQRCYRTGDWARIVDGETYFESRIDRQVKVRGHRLELGEVDAALRAAGAIAAYTLLHCPSSGAAELVSFVEARDGFDVATALTALRDTLPHYAVPARVLVLEHLPRSANDKVDHQSLADRLAPHG